MVVWQVAYTVSVLGKRITLSRNPRSPWTVTDTTFHRSPIRLGTLIYRGDVCVCVWGKITGVSSNFPKYPRHFKLKHIYTWIPSQNELFSRFLFLGTGNCGDNRTCLLFFIVTSDHFMQGLRNIRDYLKETSEGTSLDLLVHEASILMIASGSDGEGQQDSCKKQVDMNAEEVSSRQIPSLSSQITVELRRDIPILTLPSGPKQANTVRRREIETVFFSSGRPNFHFILWQSGRWASEFLFRQGELGWPSLTGCCLLRMHNLLYKQGWVNQHASQLIGPETQGYYVKLQILSRQNGPSIVLKGKRAWFSGLITC